MYYKTEETRAEEILEEDSNVKLTHDYGAVQVSTSLDNMEELLEK